jgi:DNA-binding ferritin-like protein (Dps family)
MKGCLIMDRRWNSLEQNSKQVGEGQPHRSSPHHFIYRSPETSLTPKKQMNDERSDKWTEIAEPQCRELWTQVFKPRCEREWTEKVEPQCEDIAKNLYTLWKTEAFKMLEEACKYKWHASEQNNPYNKWREYIMRNPEISSISYNDKSLKNEWYNQGCEKRYYDDFIEAFQNNHQRVELNRFSWYYRSKYADGILYEYARIWQKKFNRIINEEFDNTMQNDFTIDNQDEFMNTIHNKFWEVMHNKFWEVMHNDFMNTELNELINPMHNGFVNPKLNEFMNEALHDFEDTMLDDFMNKLEKNMQEKLNDYVENYLNDFVEIYMQKGFIDIYIHK